MAGFFDVDAGAISFGDQDVKNIPTAQLMKHVAYVAQDNFLFDTSIRENLKVAKADATDEEIQRALQAANCLELIERLPNGLNTNAGDCGCLLYTSFWCLFLGRGHCGRKLTGVDILPRL